MEADQAISMLLTILALSFIKEENIQRNTCVLRIFLKCLYVKQKHFVIFIWDVLGRNNCNQRMYNQTVMKLYSKILQK